MKKILGYLLAFVGVAGLAFALVPEVQTLIPITLPNELTTNTLMIISVIAIAVGIILIWRSSKSPGKSSSRSEVPILQGNQVVGYRRN
jgi:hypothetical protein